MKRRIAAWLACFVFVFTVTTYHVNQARAVAIVDDIAVAIIVKLLISAGVSYYVGQTVYDNAMEFKAAYPEQYQAVLNTGYAVRDAASGAMKWVCSVPDTVWSAVRSWVGEKYDVGVNQISTTNYGEEIPSSYFSISNQYDIGNGPVGIINSEVNFINTVYNYTYSVKLSPYGDTYQLTYGRSGSETTRICGYAPNMNVFLSLEDNVIYLRAYNYPNYDLTFECIGPLTDLKLYGPMVQTVSSAVTGAEGVCDNFGWDWDNVYSGDRSISVPLEKENGGAISIGTDTYDVDMEAVLTDAEAATYEDVIAQDVTGIPVAGELDIPQEGVTDYTYEQTPGSESGTSLKALFFSKFPFCLPWDLMNAFKLVAADPEAPYWEIDLMTPLKDEINFKGDTKIVIDMGDYPLVGQVFRWTSTISFVVALIVLTRKIINS